VKIVKFSDGKYGVRKWSLFGYEYLSLRFPLMFWWTRGSTFYDECRGTLGEASAAFAKMDKGTPV
jgi:hypothetical protein